MEALRTTLDCLRQAHPIPLDVAEQLFPNALPRATFMALSAIYNFALPASAVHHDDSARQVVVLQRLALAVGMMTALPTPCNHLANFRKNLFYQHFQNSQDHKQRHMLKKLFGLYPPTDVSTRVPLLLEFDSAETGDDQVGNPNWLLTRKVNFLWLQSERDKLSKEETLSCFILQANERLLEVSKDWPLWDSLWAVLYLWLTRIFLDPHLAAAGENARATWCMLSDREMWQRVKDIGEKARTPKERTLVGLVLFGVEQHILSEGVSEQFQRVVTNYCQVDWTSWQQLLTLHLIRHTASLLKHNKLAQQCSECLNKVTNQNVGIKDSPELQYLLPHLLANRQTLIRYLVDRKLDFWSYGLDQKVTEDIAKACLINLSDFNREQRPFILTHLPLDHFVDQLLAARLQMRDKHSGKAAVRTILRSAPLQAAYIQSHMRLTLQECQKDLQLFASQWDSYYTLQAEGITTSNCRPCINFLSFDNSALSSTFHGQARLPQQILSIFLETVQRLTAFLLQQEGPPICTISQLLLERAFAQRLQELPEEARDELWRQWAELMVRQEQVIEQLMGIPLQQ